MQINMVTIIIAILGAIKIVLQAFNLNIITDENINAIANGVSAVATIAGVFMSHRKVKEVQHPFEGVTIGGDSKPTNTIGNTK